MTDVIRARKIIARLDRLPIWPYPYHYLLIIGIGFFFGFFDVLTIGFALPRIEQTFGVNLQLASWTITSGLIGYIVGSFFLSRIADKFGRRISLIFSILFFSVGSFACAASFSLGWLIIWRFVTGIGIGAEISVVTTYMEELSPANIRGKSTCIAIAYGMLGFAIVPFIAYYIVPNFENGWRVLFLLGGIGGLLIYFPRRLLPDSPRWLVLHEKNDEAEAIVAASEVRVQKKLATDLPTPAPVGDYPMISDTSLNNFLQFKLMRSIVQFILIWFIYYIGNYAWLTLAPSLFILKGFDLSKSIGFIAISSFGFIFGSLISIYLSDRWERKWSAILITIVWAGSLFIIGWFPKPLVISIAGFIATTSIAILIPLLYIYTGENFPTRIRATSISITDGLGHLGGAFCAQIIILLSSWLTGTEHNYHIAFMIMAISGIMTTFLLLPGKKMTHHSIADLSMPGGY